MIDISGYLDDVKIRLATSTVIAKIETVTQRTAGDRGYFRARLSLAHGDFPELPQFPDHIHLADEQQVAPDQPLSILDLIDFIEQKLTNAGP